METNTLTAPSIASVKRGRTKIVKHLQHKSFDPDSDPMIPKCYKAIEADLERRGGGRLGLEYLKLKGVITNGQALVSDITVNVAVNTLLPQPSTQEGPPMSREHTPSPIIFPPSSSQVIDIEPVSSVGSQKESTSDGQPADVSGQGTEGARSPLRGEGER